MIATATMSLGKTLREVREAVPLTLRQVEDATGISNAYLSLLENDKIKKPSANVLYKLSAAYHIPLDRLLSAAGIIEKKDETTVKPNSIAFYANGLNEDQEKLVLKYIQFILSEKK